MQQMDQLPPAQQLDFWLGDWEVAWGEQRGSNRVQRLFNGQVIQEDFDGRPGADFQGRSLSVYSPQFQQWQQTWVDTQGNYWHLRGGWQDGQFVLVADDIVQGQPVKYRMRFDHIAGDTFDWHWELSQDGGASWELRWQLRYQRKAQAGA